MTLTTRMFELISDPSESKIIKASAAAAMTVVVGLGVEMNSDGELVVCATASHLLGIALNTPTAYSPMVDVLIKGKIRVTDVGGVMTEGGSPIAATNDVVNMKADGRYTSSTGTAIGIATNVVVATTLINCFEAQINVPLPTAST